MKVLKGMFGFSGFQLHPIFASKLAFLEKYEVVFAPFDTIKLPLSETPLFILAFILVLVFKNSMKYLDIKFTSNYKFAFFTAFLLFFGLLSLNKVSEFLYFNF